MKLNLGDKVIWMKKSDSTSGFPILGKVTLGKVTEIKTVDNEKITIITFDNGKILDFSNEQLDSLVNGEYYGSSLKIDHQSMRNDKLEQLGI